MSDKERSHTVSRKWTEVPADEAMSLKLALAKLVQTRVGEVEIVRAEDRYSVSVSMMALGILDRVTRSPEYLTLKAAIGGQDFDYSGLPKNWNEEQKGKLRELVDEKKPLSDLEITEMLKGAVESAIEKGRRGNTLILPRYSS